MGEPTSRQWYVTTNSESSSPDQMTAELDDAMKTFMQYYNVRNAQLSFGQNGVVQGERAYSWNDSEEAKLYITLTENLFLLASVSKAFCNAAIYTLYPDASIRANTRVFTDVLGYSSNDPTMGDQRLPTITIKNLTDHLGGFNDQIPAGRDNHQAWTETPDPTFDSRGVASFLGRNVTSIQDFVEYAWRNKLDFTPGTTIGDRPFLYSNLGYVILSRVVEVKSGMNYLDFLRAKVTKPIGVQVVQFFTRESQHANDQQTGLVHAESYGSGPPSYDISMNDDVPAVYGGDNVLKEACLGSASLATTASDLVKFIGSYAVWNVGGHEVGWSRTGSMAGASTWIATLPNGTDVAIVMNTREKGPGSYFISSLSHNVKGDVTDHDGNLFDIVDGPIRKITDKYRHH